MKRLFLFSFFSFASIFACSTDNGDNVFGPTFGPNGQKDGGSSSSSGGSSSGSSGGDDASTSEDGGSGDGGGDASAPCQNGTIAVLAGGDASLTGAVKANAGAWTGGAISGGAATAKPALVAFGQGFLGVTRGAGNVLQ